MVKSPLPHGVALVKLDQCRLSLFVIPAGDSGGGGIVCGFVGRMTCAELIYVVGSVYRAEAFDPHKVGLLDRGYSWQYWS